MTAGSYRTVYEHAKTGKKALAILPCWDHNCKTEEMSAEERQIGFREMIEIALGVKAVNLPVKGSISFALDAYEEKKLLQPWTLV